MIHVLLTLPPLSSKLPYYFVRLACLIHAVSIQSEPRSNSQLNIYNLKTLRFLLTWEHVFRHDPHKFYFPFVIFLLLSKHPTGSSARLFFIAFSALSRSFSEDGNTIHKSRNFQQTLFFFFSRALGTFPRESSIFSISHLRQNSRFEP